nr:O-methyltransferase [Blastococcus haudaquaticus]
MQYVGFGAHHFVDFTLIHRALGVDKMVSIESSASIFKRSEFNKPFNSIELLRGQSWERLNDVDLKIPSIVWLDYTHKLDRKMLGDIDDVALRASSPTVLIVTVNAQQDETGATATGRLKALAERIGPEAVPIGTREADLTGWSNAAVARRIVDERIKATVAGRGDDLRYRQLFNFEYRDGARMLTVGGLLFSSDLADAVDACKWEASSCFSPTVDAIRIELPVLTARELAFLDAELPNGTARSRPPGLTADEVETYRRFYRYYPRYALVEY